MHSELYNKRDGKARLTVSVIIPNYNYGRFLAEAVDSVLAQTYACHEIIVVDDGSTDDSLEILEKYKEKVIVLQQKNSGVGRARNAGVEISTGNLVAFLDADDYWMPEKIEKQVNRFAEDEAIGLVSCGMQEFNSDGKIIQFYNSSQQNLSAEKILAFNSEIVSSGSAVIVRREIFEAVGGYDERRELHPSEDWELGYRLARVCKAAFVPEILVAYRNHGGNGHLNISRMERAMLLAYDKIYRNAPPDVRNLKAESYGNLYAVLAGSYFRGGNYADFMRATARSLRYKPGNITRFLGFPLRLFKRRAKSVS